MDKLKVDVRLNTTVERKTVEAFAPDAVVIATGARGGINFWPMVGNPNVFDLFSALDRPDDDWEDKVVITTGESHECFLALYIAGRGAEVYIAEAKHEFSEDKMSPGKELLLMSLQNLSTVHLLAETTVEEIGEGYVIFQKHGEHRREEGIGSVVIGGRVSNNELHDELQASNPALEIYNVGDSVMPRELIDASHEAAEAAEMIGLRTS
jgi:2-enoate reductase